MSPPIDGADLSAVRSPTEPAGVEQKLSVAAQARLLKKQGQSITDIAGQLGLPVKTIASYLESVAVSNMEPVRLPGDTVQLSNNAAMLSGAQGMASQTSGDTVKLTNNAALLSTGAVKVAINASNPMSQDPGYAGTVTKGRSQALPEEAKRSEDVVRLSKDKTNLQKATGDLVTDKVDLSVGKLGPQPSAATPGAIPTEGD